MGRSARVGGKNIDKARKLVEARPYKLEEAAELLRKAHFVKFDETVELVLNLGVDSKQSDQMVRGTVVLPHGLGKSKRVLVIASTRFDLPRPCGSTTVPRTIWSDCLESTPKLSTSSTVSSNFTKCALRRSSAASSSLYGRASTNFRALSIFFPPTLALRPMNVSPYSVTSMPMLRAVPMIDRIAESRFVVFRSGSFCFAISATCLRESLATLLRFGSGEPFTIPAARFKSSEAGGVFRMNVKVRSL